MHTYRIWGHQLYYRVSIFIFYDYVTTTKNVRFATNQRHDVASITDNDSRRVSSISSMCFFLCLPWYQFETGRRQLRDDKCTNITKFLDTNEASIYRNEIEILFGSSIDDKSDTKSTFDHDGGKTRVFRNYFDGDTISDTLGLSTTFAETDMRGGSFEREK